MEMKRASLILPIFILAGIAGSYGCGQTAGPGLDAIQDVPDEAPQDAVTGDGGDAFTEEVLHDSGVDGNDIDLDLGGNELQQDQFVFVPVDDAFAPDGLHMDANDETDAFDMPDGVKVRAASYNLYGYHWSDAAHFGALIKEMNPDLMALVESNEDQVQAVAEAAGYEYWCTNGDGRSLLSKTPLATCETITLVGGRTLLRTETEIDGVTFAVWVMHIDWDIIGNRQTRDFMDNHFVNETRSHVIMMGDFNDEHLSRQINILEEQLADAFTAYGWYPGERVTWPAQYFDDTEGSQTIDIIFFRKSLRPIVLDADAVNMSPVLSDHKPVWADMLFPRDDQPFPDYMTMNRLDPYRVIWKVPGTSDNLVTNPGAEDGLAGWTVTGGGEAATERFACRPAEGEKFFCGFPKGYKPDDGYTRFTQEIDLSDYIEMIDANRAWLNVSAEIITCPFLLTEDDITTNHVQRYDDAEVTVTLVSADGKATDRRISKRRDTLMWYPYADAFPIPSGTRKIELALTAHKRIDYVGGIDAGFDKVYVSVREWPIHGVLDGNMLMWGIDGDSAIDGGNAAVSNSGWVTRTTGYPLSLNPFPPASVSGLKYMFAGDEVGLNPLDEPAVLSQTLDLSRFGTEIDKGRMTLRWGGFARTNTAEGASVAMSLQLLDGRGDVWGEVHGRTVWESEWIRQENRTRLPRGIRGARLVLRAEVPLFDGFLGIEGMETQDDAVFADELFIRPETF